MVEVVHCVVGNVLNGVDVLFCRKKFQAVAQKGSQVGGGLINVVRSWKAKLLGLWK